MSRQSLWILMIGLSAGCGGGPLSAGDDGGLLGTIFGWFDPPTPNDRGDVVVITDDPLDPVGAAPALPEIGSSDEAAAPVRREVDSAQARREEVMRSSKLLLKIIGTTGEQQGGTVHDLWSDEDVGFGDLDQALRNAGGVTTEADVGIRGGRGDAGWGQGQAASIDDLSTTGSGR